MTISIKTHGRESLLYCLPWSELPYSECHTRRMLIQNQYSRWLSPPYRFDHFLPPSTRGSPRTNPPELGRVLLSSSASNLQIIDIDIQVNMAENQSDDRTRRWLSPRSCAR